MKSSDCFETFGVMIDMSRNAVMTLPALKQYLTLLSKMSYNCVMLYTEDTYEVDGEPYFGYMRGRYSKAEMKEIDAFAATLGMEVIPCIQTLAHLNAIKRWGMTPFDYDDILMTDDERTYELIDRMFATLSECFTSRKIHIGMDEAWMLGRGNHLSKYGYESADAIMKRHLARVCELAEKYNYEPMMWSDMFFRPWNGGKYMIPESKIPEEYIKALPKTVTPVYWDYYQTEEQKYSDMIKNHKQLSDKTWFAGGAWSWFGMIPYNQFTIKAMTLAFDACRKHGIKNVFLTMWGDDGAECSHYALLPSLFYLSEYAKGNTDEADIKAKFESFSGIAFDDFMVIDSPNDVVPYEGTPRNPSKYMLYSDYFNDYLDYTVKAGGSEYYQQCAERLHVIAKQSRHYGYVFDCAAKLSEVLAIKYELGLRTRTAYEAGNKETLRSLAKNEYAQLIGRLETYLKAFEKQWMQENKPHGFDVQEHRLGAMLQRTKSCRRRLLNYVNGKLECIDELEEALLPFRQKEESTCINRGLLYATANVLHQSNWTI